MAGVSDCLVLVAIKWENSPRAVVEDVSVELSLAVVEAESSSVDSNDVTKASDDGEIFESLGVENEGGELVVLALVVKAGINDLEGADVSLLVGLVGEGGIDDDSEDVLGLAGSD